MNDKVALVPGLLFVLSTRVEGGVHYDRVDLDPPAQPDPVIDGDTGEEIASSQSEVSRWETTKRVEDAAEFKEACKIRSKCRSLITSSLIATPFGFLICPLDQEPLLDQRIAEAQMMATLFNEGAKHSRIRITPVRGEMSRTKEEAVSAVQQQCSVLLADLQSAIQAGEVGTIRDLSSKLTQMGKLQEKKSAARSALDRAVAAARKIARDVKRAAAAGEQVADLIEQAKTSPIAAARFVFTDGAEGAVDDELADDDGGEDLPSVAVGRFAGMDCGGEGEVIDVGTPEELAGLESRPPTNPIPLLTEAPPLAIEIIGELEAALSEFGTYSFDDKGSNQIMDLGSIEERLNALEPAKAATVLEAVARHSERADILVSDLNLWDVDTEDRVKAIIEASPYLRSRPWSPVFDAEEPPLGSGVTGKLTKASDLFGPKGGAS